jgi:histidyl-tRNA synthetase
MMFYDAEMLIVVAKTLDKIRNKYFKKKCVTVHYNNRKLINSFLENYKNKDEIF